MEELNLFTLITLITPEVTEFIMQMFREPIYTLFEITDPVGPVANLMPIERITTIYGFSMDVAAWFFMPSFDVSEFITQGTLKDVTTSNFGLIIGAY